MDKALIARHFGGAFQTYDNSAVIQRLIAAELVRLMLLNGFPKNAAIYEVGAGTGLLTDLILKTFTPSRLVANDLCLEAETSLAAISKKIEFVPGDAETLSVPSGCTTVISCSAVQWFTDIGNFFNVISQGLPAGGRFAFATFGPENVKEIREVFGVGLEYKTLEEHTALLEAAGFVIQHASETLEHIVLGTVTDLLRHIRETGTGGIASATLGVAQTRRFCREYTTRHAVDGGVTLTYHPMYFIAEKR